MKGKYIEVEPLIEEIIQDIVLPRVNFKLDTRDRKFEEDLKKYFRG